MVGLVTLSDHPDKEWLHSTFNVCLAAQAFMKAEGKYTALGIDLTARIQKDASNVVLDGVVRAFKAFRMAMNAMTAAELPEWSSEYSLTKLHDIYLPFMDSTVIFHAVELKSSFLKNHIHDMMEAYSEKTMGYENENSWKKDLPPGVTLDAVVAQAAVTIRGLPGKSIAQGCALLDQAGCVKNNNNNNNNNSNNNMNNNTYKHQLQRQQ
jgi:hypothetical protein